MDLPQYIDLDSCSSTPGFLSYTDNGIIKIHIDCISRIRGKHWDHYTDEDLENGAIVFIGCKKFFFDTNGILQLVN